MVAAVPEQEPAEVPSAVRLARVEALAKHQDGIVSRQQVIGLGFTDGWLAQRVDSGRWRRIYGGVYAIFTGPLPWRTRCRAALLRCGDDAALAGSTAIRLWAPERSRALADDVVVVAVDASRKVRADDGIDVWRVTELERLVHPAREPRRMRLESAVLLTASRAQCADDAIGTLADACQSRRTTPQRLRSALAQLPKTLRFRRLLGEILDDVATGAYSYLEVRYLRGVERPHGLPTAQRQRRVTPGRRVFYRDVEYVGYDVIAELDGRLGHEDYDDRSADMDRDNLASRDGKRTTRIGYRQAVRTPCATAQLVLDMLRAAGWTGQPRKCSAGCPVS